MTALTRIRLALAEARANNGQGPAEIEPADLDTLLEYAERPTADAYMGACRALNWRTAELRFHGHEPIRLPANAPHHPPEGFDFGAPAA